MVAAQGKTLGWGLPRPRVLADGEVQARASGAQKPKKEKKTAIRSPATVVWNNATRTEGAQRAMAIVAGHTPRTYSVSRAAAEESNGGQETGGKSTETAQRAQSEKQAEG